MEIGCSPGSDANIPFDAASMLGLLVPVAPLEPVRLLFRPPAPCSFSTRVFVRNEILPDVQEVPMGSAGTCCNADNERLRPLAPLRGEMLVCCSDERLPDDNCSGLGTGMECTIGRLSLTDVSYSYGLFVNCKDTGRG